MDVNNFKLEEFSFTDERDWFNRTGDFLRIKFISALGITPRFPPVGFKGFRGWVRVPSLSILGASIGFDDAASLSLLSSHKRRLTLHTAVTVLLYVSLAIPLIAINIFLLVYFLDLLDPYVFPDSLTENTSAGVSNFISSLFSLVLSFVLLIPIFILVSIALKIAAIIADKIFADSLCAMTVVYLILELSRDDTLIRPNRKKEVLNRINFLARNTLLLPLLFSSKSENNQDWVQKHFKNMETYIRERERWAIAPTETTLDELRRDFYRLVPLYLSGNYGSFSWVELAAPQEAPRRTWKQRLVTGLPRVFGFLFPLLIMSYFIWRPAQLEALGVKINVVILIFIAWLLLTIDTVLKLGIVASLINLAKGIKELK